MRSVSIVGGEKLKFNIANTYSIIGLIVGLVVTFIAGFIFAILAVAVVGLIVYLITNKSIDDAANCWLFGAVGMIIGYILAFIFLTVLLIALW